MKPERDDKGLEIEVCCPKCKYEMKEYACHLVCRNPACRWQYIKKFSLLDKSKNAAVIRHIQDDIEFGYDSEMILNKIKNGNYNAE